ncbi:hypothetical protein G7Z12_00570 [Streptomyces sp. ID38640]|nr:hypothetical protein [Streptomyces sp. ID38640]QIK04782.1 hypothetical protein G7Z12_00570 [Streptomyces sp. ID38640]
MLTPRSSGAADLLGALRRAGLDPEEMRLDDPMIDWRGRGPEIWGHGTG